MAERPIPEHDPIVTKSYALYYLIAVVILIATLIWGLWDEHFTMRPWKRYQTEFAKRYVAYLDGARAESAESEQEIRESAAYQKLDAALKEAEAEATPRLNEIRQELAQVSDELERVQNEFTDRRAYVNAIIYQLEVATSERAKERQRRRLESYRQQEFRLPGETERINYVQLEERYDQLRDQRAVLNAEIAELMRPIGELRRARDTYLQEQMVRLAPHQIEGLRTRYRNWTPQIRQIVVPFRMGNTPDSNVVADLVVDRCQSCHMGILEPVTLTRASMSRPDGSEDMYTRAFVSHPTPELLRIHDPEQFGCQTCHQGNGRATTSVIKGHGTHKYWLWPLHPMENVEAGCQTCHAADMVLRAGDIRTVGEQEYVGQIVSEGKELFMHRGCMGCHRYEGYDREPEELVAVRQQIRQLEQQRADTLREAALVTRQGDQAEDNREATRLYQVAQNLRVSVSHVEGRIEQLNMQSRGLLRDQKKIGPNLKEIRAKLNKNWIPEWIEKPTAFNPTTRMPNYRFNEEQVRSIAAYLWQASLPEQAAAAQPGNAVRGRELFETRGCLGCHSIGEGDQMEGSDFAVNLSRLGEKAQYDYIVQWILDPRKRLRPYCPHERRDIGPEDYAKHGKPFRFDLENSTCPNDGHELQVQQMTVMPNFRLTQGEAADIATYLISQRRAGAERKYADAGFMDDPQLRATGEFWIRHFGCAGCHEISGLENEGRIGTELTAQGSKPLERLDFALLTHVAERGGIDPLTGEPVGKWYNHKGFIERKLAKPDLYDHGKVRTEVEKLRMPDPHLTPRQIRALTTFLLGSQEISLPETFQYRPEDARRDIQEGWWVVKKYNCMGCHQFLPGQATDLMQMARYQTADGREQLPPQLLTQGARVDPGWLMRFLENPAMSETDLNRNGVRTYLQARMPTFNFSENELRKLVRFFQAYAQQADPYIPERLEPLTPRELDMARNLFTSVAAPCLACHATGDPAHDARATAPNFLLVRDRLKPGWTERWLIDPQSISPGTSMPSGLFRRENGRWVFAGPLPPGFEGYEQDHTRLLVRYMFQLTPEEQRRAAQRGGAGRAAAPAAAPAGTPGARP